MNECARLMLGASLIAAGCSDVRQAVPVAAECSVRSPTTQDAHWEKRTWVGVVVADTIDFHAEAPGIVRSIARPVGSMTQEGEILMELEQPGLRAELEVARAKLGAAKAGLGRSEVEVRERRRTLDKERELLSSGATPRGKVEDANGDFDRAVADRSIARAQVTEARAEFELLEDRRERLRVRSPGQGQISAVFVRPGALVDAGGPLLRAIEGTRRRVRFAVLPEAGSEFTSGATVLVRSESGRETRANVEHISPSVDPESGLIAVEGALEQDDLRPGVVVRVRLAVEPEGMDEVEKQ